MGLGDHIVQAWPAAAVAVDGSASARMESARCARR